MPRKRHPLRCSLSDALPAMTRNTDGRHVTSYLFSLLYYSTTLFDKIVVLFPRYFGAIKFLHAKKISQTLPQYILPQKQNFFKSEKWYKSQIFALFTKDFAQKFWYFRNNFVIIVQYRAYKNAVKKCLTELR